MNLKIYLSLILLFSFLTTFSQNEVIGKVTVVKSNNSKNRIVMSTTDDFLKFINNIRHEVIVTFKDSIFKYETDRLGIFKINKTYFNDCKIIIDPNIKELKKEFLFKDGIGEKDTINFELTDQCFSISIDSSSVPDFYNKYNVKMAELDFHNSNKRIFYSIGMTYADKYCYHLTKLSKKYGFKTEYPVKMYGTLPQQRIIYRYNKRMIELLGIKEDEFKY